MKVLLVGASGMLGQVVKMTLLDSNIQVISKNSQNLNICDANQTEDVIAEIKPDYVINCAAYTRVDDAETDEKAAMSVNSAGVRNLANSCRNNGVILVHISTDYVFDGKESTPYKETHLTNPVTVYGKSKLAGENLIIESGVDAYILRTAWLYGAGGRNFVSVMIELAENNASIKVVDDQFGQPTSTNELAKGILSLLDKKPNFGIYNATCGGKTSWHDFAKLIFSTLGNSNVELIPVSSEDFSRRAVRPGYSVLSDEKWNSNNLRPFLKWEVALQDFLSETNSKLL